MGWVYLRRLGFRSGDGDSDVSFGGSASSIEVSPVFFTAWLLPRHLPHGGRAAPLTYSLSMIDGDVPRLPRRDRTEYPSSPSSLPDEGCDDGILFVLCSGDGVGREDDVSQHWLAMAHVRSEGGFEPSTSWGGNGCVNMSLLTATIPFGPASALFQAGFRAGFRARLVRATHVSAHRPPGLSRPSEIT